MLATILKSPVATQTTLAIIETFSKIRESGRYVQLLLNEKDEDAKKPLFPKNRKTHRTPLNMLVPCISRG